MEKEKLGHIIAFITVLIWGLTFVSTKILLENFTPVVILLIRFMLGYIALLLIYPKLAFIFPLKQEIYFIAAGFFGIFLYLILENSALNYTLVSNVGLIVAISPFMSALLSYLFLKEEDIQPLFYVSALLSIIGVGFIMFNGSFVFKIHPLGDILAFIAAFSWAVYSLFVKKISGLKIHPIQATRKIFFYGLFFTVIYIFIKGTKIDINDLFTINNSLNFLFLGFGASALCFVSWSKAVTLIGTVKTSIYIYLIPVLTVISSIIILHENITLYSFIGIIFIISGLALLHFQKQ